MYINMHTDTDSFNLQIITEAYGTGLPGPGVDPGLPGEVRHQTDQLVLRQARGLELLRLLRLRGPRVLVQLSLHGKQTHCFLTLIKTILAATLFEGGGGKHFRKYSPLKKSGIHHF